MKVKIPLNTLKVNFPILEGFPDYHEIRLVQKFLNGLFLPQGHEIDSQEVAYDGQYWGIFYVKGETINKEHVKNILLEQGLKENYIYKDLVDLN